MTDVLGALEHSEGETGEEVAGGEQTRGGAQGEPGVLAEEVAHVLQLGNVVGPEDVLLLKHGEHLAVLLAEVLGHQLLHVLVHHVPGGDLSLRVVNDGDGVSAGMDKSGLSYLLGYLRHWLGC